MTWYYVSDLNGHESPQAYLDNALTSNRAYRRQKVLKSAVIAEAYYAAVEQVHKISGQRRVIALVAQLDTTDTTKYPFGYLDIDETKNPPHVDCPTDILTLLTRPESAAAAGWRRRCHMSGASAPRDSSAPNHLPSIRSLH